MIRALNRSLEFKNTILHIKYHIYFLGALYPDLVIIENSWSAFAKKVENSDIL